ncbi:putative replication protein [Zea mays]|uniref:Putative replication protein n=1 Tax=Zea mays TaxID=4577 RepID=A0A1D6MFV8_MAIZE|nr:putative replication protein [Zea mays]
MRFRCVLNRFVKSGQATSPYSTFLRRLPLLTDTIANRECAVRLRLLNKHVPTMVFSLPHVFSKIIFWFHIWCALKKAYEILLAFLIIVSTDGASPPLERSYIELLKETYKDRSYYGGPSDECPHCGAVFWFQERVKSVSAVAQRRLVYNLCCRGGKIVLEPYKCPPAPLCDLLRFDGDSRARSAETNHHPVIWDQGKAAAESTVIAVPEHKKLKDIKYLHPFENKKKEWFVIVKVLKIDSSWWYKISLTAEDDTDTAEFIFFGQMAQRLIKKNVDALISTNPPDFIPREITNLLEKSFEWNVSFTESTIIYSSVSFQVNAINAEIDGGNILPTTSSSQPSSTILSQGQGSGVTQNKGAAFIREPSLTPESHKVSSSAKLGKTTGEGKASKRDTKSTNSTS